MKRFIALVLLVVFTLCLTGCMEEETVPEEKNLEVLSTLQGSTLEKTHEIEGFEFITTYNTGDYNLSRWRITDSKSNRYVSRSCKYSGRCNSID